MTGKAATHLCESLTRYVGKSFPALSFLLFPRLHYMTSCFTPVESQVIKIPTSEFIETPAFRPSFHFHSFNFSYLNFLFGVCIQFWQMAKLPCPSDYELQLNRRKQRSGVSCPAPLAGLTKQPTPEANPYKTTLHSSKPTHKPGILQIFISIYMRVQTLTPLIFSLLRPTTPLILYLSLSSLDTDTGTEVTSIRCAFWRK